MVDGIVTIHYTNRAPVPLSFIWLQLEQNLFRPAEDGTPLLGGIVVDQATVNRKSVTLEVHGTMARIDLSRPLAARGGHAVLSLHFRFVIPEDGARRMGRTGMEFLLGQWYPRVAVYDDVRGWNTDPYLGDGEFYLEYGDFDYAVTVPAGYIVAGTGLLHNPGAVLSAEPRARLARATSDTGVVAIITAPEAAARRTRLVTGTKTWHFTAHHVRDVAWAAAPDFRWDATPCNVPGQRVLCQAFYTGDAKQDWTHAAEQTRFSIRHYSALLAPYPYPYPHATSVAGLAGGGMEYPMITFNRNGGDSDDSNFELLNHELGHQWFPMLVGSNERRYAWMDEGFNTYINQFAAEARRAARDNTGEHSAIAHARYVRRLAWRSNVPLMTGADHGGMWMSYSKTAAVLLLLHDYLVGPATFERAFQLYVRRWAYKHPTPGDFFRTIEAVSGQDLSYFWRGFFYTNDVLDYAIDSMTVQSYPREGRFHNRVHVTRLTTVAFPVVLRLKFADGSTRDLFQPVEGAWPLPGRWLSAWSTVPAVGARLWPNQGRPISAPSGPGASTSHAPRQPTAEMQGLIPDANSWNDVWGDAPDPTLPSLPASATGSPTP